MLAKPKIKSRQRISVARFSFSCSTWNFFFSRRNSETSVTLDDGGERFRIACFANFWWIPIHDENNSWKSEMLNFFFMSFSVVLLLSSKNNLQFSFAFLLLEFARMKFKFVIFSCLRACICMWKCYYAACKN